MNATLATTTERTTMEIHGDGFSSGPIPVDEFGDAVDAAAARLRNRQLSFDVGVAGGQPDFASLKISGDLGIGQDLKRRRSVQVSVTTEDGELLAQASGVVTGIAFRDKEDKHGNVTVERIHTITLA